MSMWRMSLSWFLEQVPSACPGDRSRIMRILYFVQYVLFSIYSYHVIRSSVYRRRDKMYFCSDYALPVVTWGRSLLAWAFRGLSYSRPRRLPRMSRWWCNSVSASVPCSYIFNGFITHLLEKWFSIKWFNKCFIRRISIASMLAAVTFFFFRNIDF